MSEKLTDRTLKTLTCPVGKRSVFYFDSEVRGLAVRVLASGTKSFVLEYRAQGRARRYTVGTFPTWGIAAARKKASELRREVDSGGDPLADREMRRDEDTVADLCDRYVRDHVKVKNRPATVKGVEYIIDSHIKPRIGKLKVSAVRYADIDKLHREVTNDSGPYMANRTLAAASKMFSLAVRWQLRADNPCKGIERNSETKRKRYLSAEELARLAGVLEAYPYTELVRVSDDEAARLGRRSDWRRRERPHPVRLQAANIVRLLLLTGARKGEVLAARWEQFDLKAATWTKPGATTKQKTEHRVPLSRAAIELLKTIPREGDYLFPGDEGESQKDIKGSWEAIRERAGLTDVRLHDLRHTYAAQLASAGLSLPIIGALLGHTQAATTHRYAHLYDDPLRQATERVGDLWGAANGIESAEVVDIREGAKRGEG